MVTTVSLVDIWRKRMVTRTMVHLSENWKRILEGLLFIKKKNVLPPSLNTTPF